jgi:RNA polymerase sigma-70 factor (ECF subfamily)
LLPEWLTALGGETGARPQDDPALFAQLYRRYYQRLVALCRRQVGDVHLAEDAAQETLLRALRYFDGYDPERPLWPWLRTIAVRIVHRDMQKVAAEWSTDMTAEDSDLPPFVSPPGDGDQWAVMRTALANVPGRQRAALVVRYIGDWSTADAARLFQMDVNAFEQLLWRARRRLGAEYRKLIAREQADD